MSNDVLADAGQVAAARGGASANSYEKCFVLGNLRKTYEREGAPSIRIGGLTLYRGMITAIIGYSGSGKTTLLNQLGALDLPDPESSIQYFPPQGEEAGLAVATLGEAKRARLRKHEFGFVFQNWLLFGHMKVIDNVALHLSLQKVPPRWRAKKALMMLRRLSPEAKGSTRRIAAITSSGRSAAAAERALHLRAEDFPRELSGGEQQRVAVGRALAHGPNVVFADEPTGNLDPDIGKGILELFVNFIADDPRRQRTVVVITHNLHAIFDVATRFVVLNHGIYAANLWKKEKEAAAPGPGEPEPKIVQGAEGLLRYLNFTGPSARE
jgi:putative ABC transport system ATP-binding protein